MIAELIYLLCAATSFLCCALLWRSYRRTRVRLLLWTSASFLGLTIANALLFVDFVLLPAADLSLHRTGVTLVAVILLLCGLIWDGLK